MINRSRWSSSLSLILLGGAQAMAQQSPAQQSGAQQQMSQQELLNQIDSLKARVAELESRQQTTTRAAADLTADQVLRDATRRSALMIETPLSSGWEAGKFLLRSEDGNYVLHPWFQVQFRNVTNWRQDAKGADNDDIQNGFEVRRMKFGFDGNVFSPKTTYLFNWATNRKSGVPELEEAWVKHALNSDWAVQGGQIKDPFAHESLVSSKKQLEADRAFVTDIFTGGDNYVQGVSGIYAHENLHLSAAFHDGARNNFNQNFQDFPTNNADFGAGARAELKVWGDWKNYDDFTALGTKDGLVVIGGGADYTEAGNAGMLLHTADVQYESELGWAVYAAYLGRYSTNAPSAVGTTAATEQDLYDWGFVVQVALLLNPRWEPFARYDYLHLDGKGVPAGSENDIHSITAGVNYYCHGHDAKFTVDAVYLPDGTPIADDGAGILASDGHGELVLRAQFQLLL